MNAPINTQESTAVALAGQPADQLPVMASPGNTALILDPAHLKNMVAVAEIMATGMATVPNHLRKNRGDCLAVVMQAAQWGMNPFAVAQKTHVVGGTLGYEAQLINAVVNTMAPTKDRLNYEWFGDWSKITGRFKEVTSKSKKDEDTGEFKKYRVPAWELNDEAGLGVKVWATMKGESAPRELTLLLTQARVRNSPLWADDPKQQLAYLAVKRWVRLHCPDVLLGVYTPDELEERAPKDMGAAEVVDKPIPPELLKAAQDEAGRGRDAFNKYWKGLLLPERNLLAPVLADLKRLTEEADRARTVDNAATKTQPEQPAAESGGAPTVSYESLLAKLTSATNPEALDVAADWIGELADADQRAALTAKYNELRAVMGA